MEGPNLRPPRTNLHGFVELRVGDRVIGLEHAEGNVSLSGMFLHMEGLPENTPVHIRIAAEHMVELDGVIRYSRPAGTGIQFTTTTSAARREIDELIAELVPREILAS